MSEWSLFDGRYPGGAYRPYPQPPAQFRPPAPAQARQFQPPTMDKPLPGGSQPKTTPKGESPRELRNRAEKQRRDIMHQSVTRLASIVPPVAMSAKKVDKTSVLRLSAHYLRAYKHVFGKSMQRGPRFSMEFTRSFLKTMKGFFLTSTYKGLVVVVSPNIQEYLGYTELELLGQSVYKIVHPEDHQLLKEQLFPRCCKLTSNGELLLPQEPNAAEKAAEALKYEKRAFMIRFKKMTHQRSEAAKYLTCHVEGSFRKSDDAGVYVDKHVQIGRRVRSRGNNPYASGNDIVFISVIRPITETFATESRLEAVRMEYRTRHSIDGGIIQCEHRISLITGYMIHEVNGVNAMNFMHRDDVRWVIVALREMYINHRLMGESCYRLMMKNGKFIHMRTRGVLEVDPIYNEATSFVCTNTVMPEDEGSELINQMKKKFSLKINNEEQMNDLSENPQANENQSISVEDPRQLEQVIYHLVTDLPSPRPEEYAPQSQAPHPDLSIIPPKREQIKRAIEKSYSVIKTLRHSDSKTEKMSQDQSPAGSGQKSPNANSTTSDSSETGLEQIVQQYETAVNGETQGFEPLWTYVDDYTWDDEPSTSSYNPDYEHPNVYHYGHSSRELNQMDYNNFAQSDDGSASYNCLPRPASFSDIVGTSQANSGENGGKARAAAEPLDIQIPEASTSTDGSNNSSCTQSSVYMSNTPDFETSQSMDSVTPEPLLQHADEDSLVRGAEQASPVLDGSSIDMLPVAEPEPMELDDNDENYGDARTAAEPFDIPIPGASTSTDAINNFSCTQRSVHTSNTPDFETSPSMESMTPEALMQPADEASVVFGAQQASQILDARTAATAFDIQIPEASTSKDGRNNFSCTQRIVHTSNTPDFETSRSMESMTPEAVVQPADEASVVFGAQQASQILDARTAAAAFDIQIPKASTSTDGSNNFSCTQRSVHMSNTPDFETSRSMESMKPEALVQPADEPSIVCGAEQASQILDAANEESVVRGAEQASPVPDGSSIDMLRVEVSMEVEDYPADNTNEEHQEHFEHFEQGRETAIEQNSPQAVPEEPVAPIANNDIANNNQYNPYEFVEDEEPI